MKAYQKERLENAICFFAREHQKHAHRPASQTVLYKYLSFFDFELLQSTGEAPLDLRYVAMDHGPVPIDLYSSRDSIRSELFRFEERGENQYFIHALKAPDLEYFSDVEKQKMQNLIFIFAQGYTDAKLMSDVSHERIKAWKTAYSAHRNSPIDMGEEFRDSEGKAEDQLTAAEEHFRISRALREAGK